MPSVAPAWLQRVTALANRPHSFRKGTLLIVDLAV